MTGNSDLSGSGQLEQPESGVRPGRHRRGADRADRLLAAVQRQLKVQVGGQQQPFRGALEPTVYLPEQCQAECRVGLGTGMRGQVQ